MVVGVFEVLVVVVLFGLISPDTVAAEREGVRRSDETRTMRKSDRIVEGG